MTTTPNEDDVTLVRVRGAMAGHELGPYNHDDGSIVCSRCDFAFDFILRKEIGFRPCGTDPKSPDWFTRS